MPTWEIPPVTTTRSITVQDEIQVFGDPRTRQGGGTGRNNGRRRTHGCRHLDIAETSLASELARATEPLSVDRQARRQAIRDACELYGLWQVTQDPEQFKAYAATKVRGRPVAYVVSVREAYQALANADDQELAGPILRVAVCAMVA